MIEPRIYRAAFVPAALALLLVLFSFQKQPPPLAQPQAGDVLFDDEAATTQAREIAKLAPDRQIGTAGNDATAALVRRAFSSSRFGIEVDKWEDEDGTKLTNVIGGRPGASGRQIVVIAARDAHRVPDVGGSAADTAALLEIARTLEGRAPEKTVILLSADGSANGDAGVRRWIEQQAEPDLIDGVIVLDQLGSRQSAGPLVLTTSNSHKRGNLGLERTAKRSVDTELGSATMGNGLVRQFPRAAVPVAIGAQGVLIEKGFSAVRLSGSGELDPGVEGLNAKRYDKLGRASIRLFGALNDSRRPPEHGPATYLTTGTKYVPGWAISLLALALLLPPLVAGVDALARARRQRFLVGRWFGWIGAGFAALIAGWLFGEALVLVGLVDNPPPAPLQPGYIAIDGAGWTAILLPALTAVGFWFLMRRWAAAELSIMERPGPGAGVAISLSLVVLGLITWLLNPFAALMMALPIHLWMIAALTNVRRAGAVVMMLIGLVPLLLVVAYYSLHFGLSPVNALYYSFLLVTGHQFGVLAMLVTLAFAAVFISAFVLVVVRAQIDPRSGQPVGRPSQPKQSILGPGGKPGPGALGSSGPAVRR
jgi:hypothetical protein